MQNTHRQFKKQHPNYQYMETPQLLKAVQQFGKRKGLMPTQLHDLQNRVLNERIISPITQKGENQQTGGKNQQTRGKNLQLSPLQNNNNNGNLFFDFEDNGDNEDHGYKENMQIQKQIQKKQIQTPKEGDINIANDGIDPGQIDLDNQSVQQYNQHIQKSMQNGF